MTVDVNREIASAGYASLAMTLLRRMMITIRTVITVRERGQTWKLETIAQD